MEQGREKFLFKLFVNSWAWVCHTPFGPRALLIKHFNCGFFPP